MRRAQAARTCSRRDQVDARRAGLSRQGGGQGVLLTSRRVGGRGYARLSLETGRGMNFPARASIAKHGFADCPPFADYPRRSLQPLHEPQTALILRPAPPADVPALAQLGATASSPSSGTCTGGRGCGGIPCRAAPLGRGGRGRTRNRRGLPPRRPATEGCRILQAGSDLRLSRTRTRPAGDRTQAALHRARATGGGIGAALMDWAMAESRRGKADEVQISVWCGNEVAQRFYAVMGSTRSPISPSWSANSATRNFSSPECFELVRHGAGG